MAVGREGLCKSKKWPATRISGVAVEGVLRTGKGGMGVGCGDWRSFGEEGAGFR